MKHVLLKTIFLVMLVILATSLMTAGNGKITGVVKDSTSGEPVVGANIVIEGTSLGASASVEGLYFILNVPPGVYNIRASAVGYAPVVIRNVQISSDQTVTLDFRLPSQAIGLAEVVIEAERRLVDKTLTSTRSVLSSGELNNNLPVLSVQELLNTTASVFKGRIRGSQRQETKSLLDGVDITDQFGNIDYAGVGEVSASQRYNRVSKQHEANGVVVDMNSSGLSELNVIAGAANAEYVAATAGLYSATLKEGRGDWKGRAFLRAGGGGFDRFMKGPGFKGPEFYPASDTALYFTNKRTLAAANNVKATRYIWTPGKYEIGESPSYDAEVSVGGSVTEGLGLFLTGRLFDTHGSMPNEFSRELNFTGKANYDLSSDMKILFSGVLQDRGELFGWKNRSYNDASRYFLEGVPVNDGYSTVGSVRFTHILSAETFYEVQVSNVKKSGRMGFLDSFTDANGDGIPETYDPTNGSADFLVLGFDTAKVKRFIGAVGSGRFFNNNNDDTQGIEPTITTIEGLGQVLANPTYYYESLQTSVTTLKADLTSQITQSHQLRGGVQLRLHDVSFDRRSTVISPTDIDPGVGVLLEQYDKKPMEIGLYAQDRIELSGIIVNVGARLDAFDPDAAEFANFYTPYFNPATQTFNTGARSAFVPYRGDDIGMKWFFSPRIGVSHPITENSTMYFSYSRSSQQLPFAQMYLGYNNINNTSLPNQMRVDQDPFKSTNYEFGATWEFLPRISVNANAYFREIENFQRYAYTLSGLSGQTVTTYNVFFNSGYADARGVEVTLNIGEYALEDWVRVFGRINYAWSVIKAPAGGPAPNKTSFARGTTDSIYTQLPFDDAKNFKQYLINVGGGQSALGAGFDRTHRLGYTFTLQFPYEVYVNLVGTFTSGFLYTNPTVDNRTARQLETAPSNSTVDVRLEKGFTFGGYRIGAFLDVKNMFNKTNILAYATSTGTSQLRFHNNGDPTGEYKRAILPEGTSVFDLPRQVFVGAYVDF
ncbi:MAG: TonB-dependent receptor [Ignavibacteriales bacterium]|nr:TonB-dependent receptor [Ignavibacteriales bacterium]